MAAQPGAVGGVIPPKPWVVGVYEQMREWGVLWASGGLKDQPHYLMWDVQMVADIIEPLKASRGAAS